MLCSSRYRLAHFLSNRHIFPSAFLHTQSLSRSRNPRDLVAWLDLVKELWTPATGASGCDKEIKLTCLAWSLALFPTIAGVHARLLARVQVSRGTLCLHLANH